MSSEALGIVFGPNVFSFNPDKAVSFSSSCCSDFHPCRLLLTFSCSSTPSCAMSYNAIATNVFSVYWVNGFPRPIDKLGSAKPNCDVALTALGCHCSSPNMSVIRQDCFLCISPSSILIQMRILRTRFGSILVSRLAGYKNDVAVISRGFGYCLAASYTQKSNTRRLIDFTTSLNVGMF